MLDQTSLYLCRIAVEATDNEHILEAVGNLQVAMYIQIADIARVEPTLGINGLRGRLRVIEITPHHMKTAQADFPRHARGDRLVIRRTDAHFSAFDGPATGAGNNVGGVIRVADGRQAATLSQPIGGGHHVYPKLAAHALDQHRRDRR
ncbi:hypothetical protein D3C79_793970 [compost metagenome]